MQPGRDYWYTATFLLPSSVARVDGHYLSLMDFKHLIGRVGSVPTVAFNILPGGDLRRDRVA
jgi:hypothetical protein